MAVRQPETAEPGPPAPPSARGATAEPPSGGAWSLSPRSQPPGREMEPLLSAAPARSAAFWKPWESHRGLVSPGVKNPSRGAHARPHACRRGHCDSQTARGRGLGEKWGGLRGGPAPGPGRPLCSDAVTEACPQGLEHAHTLRLLRWGPCTLPHRPRHWSASPVSPAAD